MDQIGNEPLMMASNNVTAAIVREGWSETTLNSRENHCNAHIYHMLLTKMLLSLEKLH